MDTGKNSTEGVPSPKSGDYLWDRSGEPDPEIQKLESLLGKFRHDSPIPAFPPIVPGRRWRFLRWRLRLVPALATAAVVAAAIIAATFLFHSTQPTPTTLAGWDVSEVQGAPRIGRKPLSANEGTSRLGIGQLFETDSKSRASLRADDTGKIQVDPSTRLRLLSMGSGLKRIALDRGTIHAYIWAPPGQFVVDTPSAVTVDLGCAYTLQVDDSGAGMVRTSLGWVGFKLNGRESFIPAGAACATRPKVGPGTPYFEGSSAKFRAALTRLDFEDSTPKQRADDVAVVLNEARKVDSLTLWHLLARVDNQQRVLVYDQLSRFVPPPVTVTKDGILRLDQPMLDQWWNELGFDDISVWRHWERSWAGTATQVREK
jgi:hypothetical protein